MWGHIALFIIKFRRILLLLIAVSTLGMAYVARNVEMTYDFAQVVSPKDPDMVYFQQFKKTFGEDGNILVLGMQDSAVYKLPQFRLYDQLANDLVKVPGVSGVLGLPKLIQIQKDTVNNSFVTAPVFAKPPTSQAQLDSLMRVVNSIEFYKGQVVAPRTGATLLAVTLDPKWLNSDRRKEVMNNILNLSTKFEKDAKIKLHYAGLPYVRSTMTSKVSAEMKFFAGLMVVVMAIILFVFFRTWSAVVVPLLVVIIVMIWCVASIVLLGFKINLLTGLIPSILVVISVPNCTYLLSRYHYDYRKSGNQVLAMTRVIRKIGLITLVNNTTTAIGFFVFTFTDIAILYQFGLVATINIFVAFIISFIMIPAVFTYLPGPTDKQLEHLDSKPLVGIIHFLDFIVLRRRRTIYLTAALLVGLASIGISRIEAVSFMVDDLPKQSSVNEDLSFFEARFGGVMPLEFVVDTKQPKGLLKLPNLQKIDQFDKFLQAQPELSTPISMVTFLKAAKQAFYNGNPEFYKLPDKDDKSFILSYLANSQGKGANSTSKLLKTFMDSTQQRARISVKIADIGSHKLDTLVNKRIEPAIKRIFAGTDMEVRRTGTTVIFTKGNEYVIGTLGESLMWAFGLVALVVLLLFHSVRTIFYALIPNILTLTLTAGVMGYFGIALKPATALIYVIALGIDGDNSIHLLAKFRQEMAMPGKSVSEAITNTLSEAGSSMFYTSIVLFIGFSIYGFSEFGGTKALGVLMGASLLITNFSNLIFLPALLVTFERGGSWKTPKAALVHHYDESYHEEDDDIDLNLQRLSVEQGNAVKTT
ncbi:efflux RND transporter permease subunit [Hymenobacter cheonanensis]|uniref:efflux RND transporter permease subunit n=1 Tax=Hymenobacter sp. CA2-7 TaxID=3063993 RepID=UPI0027131D7C|nr:MMPL family transporter [Hymenobacter sp. CA2-7]MDO7884866.1 MMPL family transporter [Hymenobacter sp. CA2-7]